jgi:hypothetical protein
MDTNINKHHVKGVNISADLDWIDIEVLGDKGDLCLTLFTKGDTLDVLRQLKKQIKDAVKEAERHVQADKILNGED